METGLIYLAQTDTTVGLLSQSAERLARAKGRAPNQPFLKALPSWAAMEMEKVGRVPAAHRRFVRRAVKQSFVLPNGASFRVVEGGHRDMVARFGWLYTTSANRHRQPFEQQVAMEMADVWVEGPEGLHAAAPSVIWRLGRTTRKRLR
jgi:tRNA A37 threonylcarbamoyladenosine synthetase subunit TsaC/SUA5/YrdC